MAPHAHVTGAHSSTLPFPQCRTPHLAPHSQSPCKQKLCSAPVTTMFGHFFVAVLSTLLFPSARAAYPGSLQNAMCIALSPSPPGPLRSCACRHRASHHSLPCPDPIPFTRLPHLTSPCFLSVLCPIPSPHAMCTAMRGVSLVRTGPVVRTYRYPCSAASSSDCPRPRSRDHSALLFGLPIASISCYMQEPDKGERLQGTSPSGLCLPHR